MTVERFQADVRVGRGLRPISRDGALLVEDGTVKLYDGAENVIARAQVGDVWAHKARFPVKGLQIHIDGSRYTLDDAAPPRARLSPARLVTHIKRTGDLSDAFLAWFAAHGANVGKPS